MRYCYDKERMNHDGSLVCEIQANTFEKSIDELNCSSEIFIRRFMKSKIAKTFDNQSILDTNLQPLDVLERIDEEYGVSTYGSVKYTHDEMYWIGYLYRYFCVTYDVTSSHVYKTIKPKELRDVYLPYHTLDPSQAIERILEAKGLLLSEEEELQRQYEIFKRIRMEGKK